ncbi:LPS export ABC transporter permease LptF [Methylocapsa sp. S129]|uniref:LPS export ABC transporter permease LptF n=1 Tax=Methylocapsa sp. S129 TaxID=1641869 RepID=UPI00131DD7C7|nr:LPS export ABC transporter permease LptF [Methylocapsa sp. S129]
MTRIERYIFRTAMMAFLSGLFALTAVIWVTQALRQFDLLTSKGQTIIVFFTMTGLTIPSLVAIIAPVALFVGVLYCLNKLNGDSELVVMSASGVSPGTLLRPFVILFCAVFALVGAMTIKVMPWSFDIIQELTARIHADFITNFARAGAFTELEAGFVFHYRERGPDGSLHGVFMQDRRDPAHITSYIAELGQTVEKDGLNYLVLAKGSYQRPQESGDSAMVTFENYTIDLSQFTPKEQTAKRPRERTTAELLNPDLGDETTKRLGGRLRAELLDRLASPFYAFAAGLIGFAALGEARTTRQGRGVAIGIAVLTFGLVRLLGIAASTFVVSRPRAELFVWTIPLATCIICLDTIFHGVLFRAWARARLILSRS